MAETQSPMEPMWPRGASAEYVAARVQLAHAERALSEHTERVAQARRALPGGTVLGDYALTEGPADLTEKGRERTVTLADLFGPYRTLVVYHLMFAPEADEACPMCSMWVDGFHGVAHHIARHTAFAVIAKAPIAKLRAWGYRRGWDGLRLVSSHGTGFNADLNTETPDGDQRPVVSVFVKEGDAVRHFYSQPANFLDASERGIDALSPVWNLLDLLPEGRGSWYAENGYAGRER